MKAGAFSPLAVPAWNSDAFLTPELGAMVEDVTYISFWRVARDGVRVNRERVAARSCSLIAGELPSMLLGIDGKVYSRV